MILNPESQWKKLLQETPFPQCIGVWEEILTFLENQLDEALGKETEEKEEVNLLQEREERFLLFTQLLSSLEEREENTLKTPEKRWEAIQNREVKEIEKLTLAELLSLYELYLTPETPPPDVSLDSQFQKLLGERKMVIKKMVREKEFRDMDEFFYDCPDRKATIATFLILLDLVFRKELQMRRGEDGRIYFGKTYPPVKEPN